MGHLSDGVATRRQSLSLPNMISTPVAGLVSALVVFDSLLAGLSAGDIHLYPFVFQSVSESVCIIAPVRQHPLGPRQAVEHGRVPVIADLVRRYHFGEILLTLNGASTNASVDGGYDPALPTRGSMNGPDAYLRPGWSPFCWEVRMEGFEPSTLEVETPCSVRLSYMRKRWSW